MPFNDYSKPNDGYHPSGMVSNFWSNLAGSARLAAWSEEVAGNTLENKRSRGFDGGEEDSSGSESTV